MKTHGFHIRILSKWSMSERHRLYITHDEEYPPSLSKYLVSEFFTDGLVYNEKLEFWTNDRYEFKIKLGLIGCVGKIGMISKDDRERCKSKTRYISYYDE